MEDARVTDVLTACRYCSAHCELPEDVQASFALHRDILHALLLPVLQIRSQAALHAATILAPEKTARPPCRRQLTMDFEVAFRGQARSGFTWLQCFVSGERDWVATKGCPACVVLKVLDDEPFIRIVAAATKVSAYLHDMLLQANGANEADSLPDFTFWLDAVREAVSEDEFWGLHFWTDIEARAIDLEAGIKELVSECIAATRTADKRPHAPSRSLSCIGNSTIWARDVQNGAMVKRELRLKAEEHEWMRTIIQACWSTLLAEAARTTRVVSATRWQQGPPPAPRKRSMTS